MKKVNFIIPEFYDSINFNLKLITLVRQHPEMFRDNINISTFYGIFPQMLWNGGRINLNYYSNLSLNDVKTVINDLNEANISLRFTCTNHLLEEKHINDYRCNEIMSYANESGMNTVLVNSPLLEKHIRNNYPNIGICISATQCINDVNKINELLDSENYEYIIPHYTMIKNLDELSKISNKDRIELMINEPCSVTCKYRHEHYTSLAKLILNQGNDIYINETNNMSECKELLNCPYNSEGASFYDMVNNPNNCVLNNKQLDELIDMGFSNFKIVGRHLGTQALMERYIYYMVKEEYQPKLISDMLYDGLYKYPISLK